MATSDAPHRRRFLGAAATLASVAVLTALAVVWPGYDAQQTPLNAGSVWALQNGVGSAYARVNLELGEVDTVKQVENGSALAQTPQHLFVFSDAGTHFADVDLALPASLTAETADVFATTPPGTIEIDSAGDYLAFRTDDGEVYTATLSGGGKASLIDPYAGGDEEDEPRPRFVADAIAVDENGTLHAYSSAEGRMLRADAGSGRIYGLDELPAAPAAPAAARLTAVGDRWVLVDEAGGDVYVRGRGEPVATGTVGEMRVQKAAAAGDEVYLADSRGLVRIGLGDGSVTRIVDEALGSPVAPVRVGGRVLAAWLGEGAGGGWLWTGTDLTALDYGGSALDDEIDAVFVVNGDRAALNERRSGWVWTAPEGRLVASSQQWMVDDRSEAVDDDELEAQRVIDPRPPVAVDDVFGVRAGSVVRLPVLLNDHDPNEDVLSIDPGSLQQPGAAFGSAVLTGAEQEIVLHVAPDATGTATLVYRASDGTASDGLLSEPATVALTVVPDDVNGAPVWCGSPGCLATWPQPTVAPGGTVSADLLSDWVDPDGDPLYLAGASIVSGAGAVTTSPGGTLTYQHPDPGSTETQSVVIVVTVSDARGATATRELVVTVAPTGVLTADSFAVTGVVGEPVLLDLASHVRGATGRVALTGAVTLDEARSVVSRGASGLSAVFTASQPGSYLVQYTVRDEHGEATAVVRVVVRDGEQTWISTPPLTAFVRPGEDATVDVLSTVHNPAGLVLLVSDLRPQSDPLAAMSVDAVGHSLLRVSGSTDSGRPGLLGVVRYTVSDGTGRTPSTTTGELTVVLRPASTAEPPIAVDDAVTVRAGDQIDIPVLDNDTAPAGALIAVDPSKLVNESGGGLAFATPRVVRYFAPTEPGVYGIGYTIYRLGFPEVTDTARIVVTVIGDETNQAPMPRALEGRVLSGESVRIPFSSFGVDPDGDAAVLDRVLTQPEHGSAAVTAEGDAIVYTSPAGFSGQVRFTYRVRDARGATGSAEVRVGVLDTLADTSPVTYSDYIQIQAGETNSAVIRPVENDIDPSGGALELVSISPGAPPGSPEHERLAARVGPIVDGAVTIAAGTELGTFSYSYLVRNTAGDTAAGLVVVKVVRERVPDFPVVTDTVLTLETREGFPRGIDVLSGKVSWTAGDVEALTLTLWGDRTDVSVNGRRISGEIPEESLLIPFEVSGLAFDGSEVSSYGFLRVPGTRDVRLSLRANAPPFTVQEKDAVEFDVATVVAGPAAQALEVDAQGVRAGGARSEASCRLVEGTVLRYEAGAGAPWTDVCVVPVKLPVHDDYTYLSVRIRVEAEEPQPVLRGASITVSPGETAEYDLRGMVGWTGREDWGAIDYAASFGGDQFVVEREGGLVRVTARETSRPGREEAVTVSLPSHPGARSAALILTVGPAPSALPRGGTAEARCTQADGDTACVIDVIGAPGEVNPLPGTPLKIVSASGSDNCSGVAFQVADARTIRASWTEGRAGAAECTGTFVVEDAQGRQSSGDRDGRVILDLQGLPATPARVDWTAFDAATVTLRAISDTGSHPAVTGYEVVRGGAVVATCPASGLCPAIEAPLGVPATYSVRAVSPVGVSRGAVEVSAWPYRAPGRPESATFVPVPAGDDGGVATVTVTGLDATTGRVRLTGGREGERIVDTGGLDTVVIERYDVGSNRPVPLTVTPLTGQPLPGIPGGAQEGASLTFDAHGVGAPQIETSADAAGGRVTVTITTLSQSAGTEMRYGFAARADSCRADGTTATRTFDAPPWELFTMYTCAQSVWSDGRTGFGVATSEVSLRPVGTIEPPPALTYDIETRPEPSGDAYEYRLVPPSAPSHPPHRDFVLVYEHDGQRMPSFAIEHNVPPGTLVARWCDTGGGESHPVCSAPAPVTARSTALYPVRVEPPAILCTTADTEAPAWRPPGIDAADASVVGAIAREPSGDARATYTVSWLNRLDGLHDVSFTVDCAPAPEPEPSQESSADSSPPAPPRGRP